MSGFFFGGSDVAKLDEKGRFVLPQEMRYGLVEEGKCEFVIGLGFGGCLAIYRKSAMAEMVAKFQAHRHVAKYQKFFTLFFSTLCPGECDKVGRVHLPSSLRSAMGMEKEIVVAGVIDRIEIWSKKKYDEMYSAVDLAKTVEEGFSLLHDEPNGAAEVSSPSDAVSALTSLMNPLYASP